MSLIDFVTDDENQDVVERFKQHQRNRDLLALYIQEQKEQERYNWESRLRPTQKWPEGDYTIEIKMAGRGFGKSLSGAVWVARMAKENPGCRIAVLAPTTADTRDTCIEGNSGVLNVVPRSEIKHWNRSMGELIFANGARIKTFSGDEPERLRGPNHHFAWVDELAAFRYPEAWDQMQFGLRLGERPLVMVTTTPRPTKLLKALLEDPRAHVTRGSTFDNAANLAPSALEALKKQYEGTRLGRQELYAELLTDVPGALATLEQLDESRRADHVELSKVVVSVDPAITNTTESDETGITAQGLGIDGEVYLLADRSGRFDVDDWALRAVQLALDVKAGKLLYEKNQGADAIGSIIRQAMRVLDVSQYQLKVEDIQAVKSKFDRALSLQQAIQQNRWHPVGSFPELEEELTTWTIDSKWSPNRIDAAVHGFNELTNSKPRPRGVFYGP